MNAQMEPASIFINGIAITTSVLLARFLKISHIEAIHLILKSKIKAKKVYFLLNRGDKLACFIFDKKAILKIISVYIKNHLCA